MGGNLKVESEEMRVSEILRLAAVCLICEKSFRV